MTTWRLLCDDGNSAAGGLALDEALMARVARDRRVARPTLRLYTYADHAALVGRYQTLAAEVDLRACEQTGIGVSRRPTGGGAIVMGHDQLGVALVLPARSASPRALIADLGGGVVEGLRRIGVHAGFGGKNDVLAGGRKIAGLGLYLDNRGSLLFHASLLVGLDIDLMLRVLTIPAAKLAGNGAASVAERVTTVRRETGREVDMEAVRDVIAEGFAARFGVDLVTDRPDEAEHAAAAALVSARYADPGWLQERNAQPDGTGSATFRSPDGLVRVFVAAQGSLVKSLQFAGDFNAVPAGLRRLEHELRWRRLNPDAMRDLVAEVRAGTGDDAGWRRDDDVVAAVLSAGESAVCAAPVRPTGSCYFPDPTVPDPNVPEQGSRP